MRIGITGASGFIASHLIPRLRERGHSCVAFSRDASRSVPGCDETRSTSSPLNLKALDAVVNLAGESILGRWTQAKKARIRASRIDLTRAIVEALPNSEVRVLVSASATGIYGDRGDESLPESTPPGSGFLADVCVDWERAALAAKEHGVRVAIPRIGFVVAPRGGALENLRPLFRLGLGGRIGNGRQWMPWIHLDDVCGLIIHLLEDEQAHGAFNAAAPNPVTNAEFTRDLAASLHRPAFFHVPAIALRTLLGELSHVALDSTRALPEKTLASGYRFQHQTLVQALS